MYGVSKPQWGILLLDLDDSNRCLPTHQLSFGKKSSGINNLE